MFEHTKRQVNTVKFSQTKRCPFVVFVSAVFSLLLLIPDEINI